jgi:hypothetical protein
MSTEHPELNDILIYLTIYKVSFYLCYRVFHGFGQAKLSDGGLILGSSQFPILPQLPQKTMLGLKEVKMDSILSYSRR